MKKPSSPFSVLALMFTCLLAGLAAGYFGHGLTRLEPPGGGNVEAGAAVQLWTCGMHPQVIQPRPGLCPICHMKLTPLAGAAAVGSSGGGEARILYYLDPTTEPPYVAREPGKSPAGNDLIPVREDQAAAGLPVTIDPTVVQNMGIRVAAVTEGPLETTVRAFGHFREAQPAQHDFSLKVGGWIRRLHADSEGMHLLQGAALFDLYSPELLEAQAELIAARRALEGLPGGSNPLVRKEAERTLETAREKLLLWDVAPEDVEAIAGEVRPRTTILFRSPIEGHLIEKMVVEGSRVEAGMKVFRIVDHSVLWLELHLYERQLSLISTGMMAASTVLAFPGRIFWGRIVLIHPHVEEATRAAMVRVVVENPSFELRPGMYARAEFKARIAERAVQVPREAIIDTGERQIAFVVREGGRFDPRRVRAGSESSGGMVQVLEGLLAGEIVVTSGQFLLDVESRTREAIRKLMDERRLKPAVGAAAPPPSEGMLADPAVRSALRPHLDALLLSYVPFSRALAADDGNQAASAAAPVVAAAEALARTAAGGPLEKLASETLAGAKALENRPLAEARRRFMALSKSVIDIVRRVPPSPAVGSRVLVIHCPMAPGEWIQFEAKVQNPFYGASMLECGEVVQTILPEPAGGGTP